MGDEASKKRKRRRRSKETSEDDAGVSKEVTRDHIVKEELDGSDGKEAADNHSDDDEEANNKKEVGDDNEDGDADQEADGDEPKKRKRKRKRKNKTSNGEDDTPAANIQEAPSATADATSYTVFIEGLPFTSTPNNVRYFFEQHDCTDIIEMRLPTWQDSGRLRGFGHVVFGSLKTKEKALKEVNGKELGGRYVTVQEAKAPRAGTSAGEYFHLSLL